MPPRARLSRSVKGSSFSLCALASLAVHLGLAAVMTLPLARGRADEPQHAGSGTTADTTGPAALGGETFEIQDESPPPEHAGDPGERASEGAEAEARIPLELDESPSPSGVALPRPFAPRPALTPRAASARSAREAIASAPPPPPPAMYGAVGDRAASDLVVTFKRAFPQAGSSDPTWNQVPVGFFAEGDVTFILSESGALTHARVSPAAAPAFRAAITRTVALIKGRSFTSRGAETRLHMRVHVSDTLTNHGAFTIDAAGSFELPSGRHVAVTIAER
jgi:hypothetical protein